MLRGKTELVQWFSWVQNFTPWQR